jgi:NitT/TauT family transport system ATP-binding protein
MMFQEYGLFPWLTVAKNVEFALKPKVRDRRLRQRRVLELIDLLELSEFANAYPHEISGGMKQRVAIARALAPEPQVVLMDEPFAALDSLTRERIQEEILSIWGAANTTAILVTHNIDEAVFLSDRVLVMTRRPGVINGSVTVEFQGPRSLEIRSTNRRFLEYRQNLYRLLERDNNLA